MTEQEIQLEIVTRYPTLRKKIDTWLGNMPENAQEKYGSVMDLNFALPMILDLASPELMHMLHGMPSDRKSNVAGIAAVMMSPTVDPSLREDVARYAAVLHGIEDYRPDFQDLKKRRLINNGASIGD